MLNFVVATKNSQILAFFFEFLLKFKPEKPIKAKFIVV